MSSPKGFCERFTPEFQSWCRKVRHAAEHYDGDGAGTLGRDTKSFAECLLVRISPTKWIIQTGLLFFKLNIVVAQ